MAASHRRGPPQSAERQAPRSAAVRSRSIGGRITRRFRLRNRSIRLLRHRPLRLLTRCAPTGPAARAPPLPHAPQPRTRPPAAPPHALRPSAPPPPPPPPRPPPTPTPLPPPPPSGRRTPSPIHPPADTTRARPRPDPPKRI